MSPLSAMFGLWGLWFVSWMLAASWSNRVESRPDLRAEILYRGMTVIGVLLLFAAGRFGALAPRLWTWPIEASWCLIAIGAAGFGLCWWARIHLGRLWSSSVTRKADHHIVDSGPYSLVRHPIYSGIIVAAAATALLQARIIALVGLAILICAFWIKARLEERFLRGELGQAYDAYARRTGMLFPGL